MSDDLKAKWDSWAAEAKASPDAISHSELLKRVDELMAPVNALSRQFKRERDHQPFYSQAPCPICGGTVTYDYRAPLVGSMKCDRPGCIKVNF